MISTSHFDQPFMHRIRATAIHPMYPHAGQTYSLGTNTVPLYPSLISPPFRLPSVSPFLSEDIISVLRRPPTDPLRVVHLPVFHIIPVLVEVCVPHDGLLHSVVSSRLSTRLFRPGCDHNRRTGGHSRGQVLRHPSLYRAGRLPSYEKRTSGKSQVRLEALGNPMQASKPPGGDWQSGPSARSSGSVTCVHRIQMGWMTLVINLFDSALHETSKEHIRGFCQPGKLTEGRGVDYK